MVFTANGEVHTHEEAQVFVHDLNLFVTVQLLEETPAVPSPGKLCENHGCSYEWVSGQKPPTIDQRWEKSIIFKTPLVVPGLSINSESVSSSTSPPQDSSNSSSSPVLERSDETAPRKWCRSTPKNSKQK